MRCGANNRPKALSKGDLPDVPDCRLRAVENVDGGNRHTGNIHARALCETARHMTRLLEPLPKPCNLSKGGDSQGVRRLPTAFRHDAGLGINES